MTRDGAAGDNGGLVAAMGSQVPLARLMSPTHPEARQRLVVYAKRKARVSAFYQRTLGVQVIETAATHDRLAGAGIDIVVHAIPRGIAATITVADPPQVREDTPFKPVFVVDDLAVVQAAAAATGGSLQPLARAWRYDGMIVLDGHDPEGNVVQFRQRER